jgi:hypothetical protein
LAGIAGVWQKYLHSDLLRMRRWFVLGLPRLIGLKVALAGLIPAFISVALLVYVYFLAAPLEDGPKA